MPPRHPNKDIREIIKEAQAKGWRVEPPRSGYWKIWCPCPGKHWSTVKISPSNPKYIKQLLGKLRRGTCWDEEGKR